MSTLDLPIQLVTWALSLIYSIHLTWIFVTSNLEKISIKSNKSMQRACTYVIKIEKSSYKNKQNDAKRVCWCK